MNFYSFVNRTYWAAVLVVGILFLLISALALWGAPTVVTEDFLTALERMESQGRASAVGARGERGSFQFRRIAWQEVNRKWRPSPAYAFDCATNRVIARCYARRYLLSLEQSLAMVYGRSPTLTELYCAWNLGPTGFARRGFKTTRCPLSVRQRASTFYK